MEPSSPEMDNFKAASFLWFALDENGNIVFETHWGESMDQVQRFATLLQMLTQGELTNEIMKQLRSMVKDSKSGKKKYSIVDQIVNKKEDNDLAVSPMEVEIV